jgi:hypothetical protein
MREAAAQRRAEEQAAQKAKKALADEKRAKAAERKAVKALADANQAEAAKQVAGKQTAKAAEADDDKKRKDRGITPYTVKQVQPAAKTSRYQAPPPLALSNRFDALQGDPPQAAEPQQPLPSQEAADA